MIKVVVVERDPVLGRLYEEELSEAGFSVRVRRGVDEACASLRRQSAHILVTDVDSMDRPLAAGLNHLRQIYHGPLLLLGPAKACRDLPQDDLMLVEKTSDLTILISHLRGRTLSTLLASAVSGTC